LEIKKVVRRESIYRSHIIIAKFLVVLNGGVG